MFKRFANLLIGRAPDRTTWDAIVVAHERLGLDPGDEHDAKLFRAAARRTWRYVHPDRAQNEPLASYDFDVYKWFADQVLDR